MPSQYLDYDGFAFYDGENKKRATGAQIAQAKLSSAVAKISGRVAKLEKSSRSATEQLAVLQSAFDPDTELAEAELHPERLYMYVPCQSMSEDSFDPGGTLTKYSRECMIFRQGKTVIMVDTGGAYSVTLIRNFCKSIGVDHVDYLIISHFHSDHSTGFSGVVGTAEGAMQNYSDSLDKYIDFSKCKVFLPLPCHEIDPSSSPSLEYDSFFAAKLEELGIEPEYPNELDTLVVNKNLKITFFNAGRRALEEIRSLSNGAGKVTSVNDCSMCCLVQHETATFFLTGDMMGFGEERLARKYQRLRLMDVTPGMLNQMPSSGSVQHGTLLRWDENFVPESSDGIGPLVSAENFYRKIFHPDVFKVGHHSSNQAGRHTSDAFYATLKPKTAFIITTANRDDSLPGGTFSESNASLLGIPIYPACLDDLRFVSDGISPACTYGSLDWAGGAKKIFYPGLFLQLHPAAESTVASGNHAVWARVAFTTQQRPFSLCIYVSSILGANIGSALIEFSFTQEADGSVSKNNSVARIINATEGFSGVFGMVYEGEGRVNLTVKKDAGVVWSASIVSVNFIESAILSSPVYAQSYTQENIDALYLPKWYKAVE